MTSPRACARAVDELKRGEAVAIDGRFAVLAVELTNDDSLAAFAAAGDETGLLITPERAAILKLGNRIAGASGDPVWITRQSWHDVAGAVAIADPVRDLDTPLKGPFTTRAPGDWAATSAAALKLAKLAALLPALFIRPLTPADGGLLTVSAADVAAYTDAHMLRLVTRARLPIDVAADTEVVAFRAFGGPEHLALVIGDPPRHAPVLMRIHSACLTGDVLGSLKCDCGPQLRAALAAIVKQGGGVLLYLQQEGRGIGLINKLRAYALQDQGFDTVDANLRLGFEIDERDFGLAAEMLRQLGFARVRLMTNNPGKVAGLSALGVDVVERVPHSLPANPHNAAYLSAKRDRTGHIL